MLGAGCGGDSSGDGQFGDGAKAMPAGTLVFAQANADGDSDAWQQLEEVGSRFPDWDTLVADFRTSLNEDEDFAKVEDALGSEVAFGLTGVGGDGNPEFVAYADLDDEGAARDAIANSEHARQLADYRGYDLYEDTGSETAGYAAIGDGALLLGSSEDAVKGAVDRREGDGTSLADEEAFTSAADDMPADALANVWVNGERVAGLLGLAQFGLAGSDPAAAAQLRAFADRLKDLDTITATLRATDGGFEVASTIRGPGAADLQTSSDLIDRVPADAFLLAAASNIGEGLTSLAATPRDGSRDPHVREGHGHLVHR